MLCQNNNYFILSIALKYVFSFKTKVIFVYNWIVRVTKETYFNETANFPQALNLNIHRHCQLYEPLWIMVSTNSAFVSIMYVVIQLVAQFNILNPRGL